VRLSDGGVTELWCLRCHFVRRSSARLASSPTPLFELPRDCSLDCGQHGSVPSGGRPLVAFLRQSGSVDGPRVRWFTLG
jgi:hypothetical protein